MKRYKPYPNLWILVDKRGSILETGTLLRPDTSNLFAPTYPLETIWRNRSSARQQLSKIRNWMTKECWDTWKFQVVHYAKV